MSDDGAGEGDDPFEDEAGENGGAGDPDPQADPFDELRDADREGDPFERLGGPASDPDDGPVEPSASDGEGDADRPDASGEGPDASGASDQYAEPDPFEYIGDEQRGSGSAARSSTTGAQGGDPMPGAGVQGGDPMPGAGVQGRDPEPGAEPASTGTADPLSDVAVDEGDPFDAASDAFEQVDVDAVDPDEVWARLTGEAEPDAPPEPEEDDVVDVSKHSFCEGCPHFSAPPDVHCGHEGTEILEFVDIDTVRVANCPVVVERRELGGFEE